MSGGNAFIHEAGIKLEAVTAEHAQAARRAWRRFGKGNHPAGLNFGDCFAYALAEATREPLLFKGGDFDLTDINTA
ncbi:MAG: type II toxin-antitoxin system VapC family toxin [Acidimicrobiaceae bacterium]|nr:type II toxin-antitoxin system VapC family toxin [Acidimicrobiaceae bacterium]